MSESSDTRIAVVSTQLAEVCRRVEEIRTDVRQEQAETREEMRKGFARLETRDEALEKRVRDVEVEQAQAQERLSTWRAVTPVLSGIAASLGAWSKDLVRWLQSWGG